jgi:hypothetical protein
MGLALQCEQAIKATPPWESSQSGVVSLWEMQQFYGDFIVKFLSELGALERLAVQEQRETLANPAITVDVCAKLGVLQGLCFMYSLNASDQQCQRIISNCQSKGMHVSCGEMRDDLRELRRRFEDDFKATYFLQLNSKQSEEFQNPTKGWEEIRSRFRETVRDIEEMQKCFSLERYPASVFHSMQVIEHGLIHLGGMAPRGR